VFGLTERAAGVSAPSSTFTTSYLIMLDPNEPDSIVYLHEIRDDGTRGPIVTTIHPKGSPLLAFLRDWQRRQVGLAVVAE